MATRFRCTMVMGFRPAGFIMNATMNTAMMVISPPIMRMSISPRNCALSSTRMTPTAAKETSSQYAARTIESARKTRQPLKTASAERAQKVTSRIISPPPAPGCRR